MEQEGRNMSELIDREAVREFIKSYRNSTDVAFHMEDHLDEIPTASPWHRVEEKPKEADQYFVIWENNGDRGGGAAWFSLRLGWIWGGPKITHWMPIEPPKEDA
jgi:hypothetical protein